MADLGSVLVGAGLAVSAQWFVTPHVQRRMRARERWEQDVLELGHLLTVELPTVREAAYSAWLHWYAFQHFVEDQTLDKNDPKIALRIKELEDEARKPTAEWEHLTQVRLPWVASRVAARFDRLDIFERRADLYRYQTFILTKPFLWTIESEVVDQQPEWDKEANGRERTVVEVTKIAEAIGPGRPGPFARRWRRIQWRLHNLREKRPALSEVTSSEVPATSD